MTIYDEYHEKKTAMQARIAKALNDEIERFQSETGFSVTEILIHKKIVSKLDKVGGIGITININL